MEKPTHSYEPITEPVAGFTYNESISEPVAEVFNPSIQNWEFFRDEILALDKLCFGDKSYSEEELRSFLEDQENIVVLLRKGAKVIGFSIAVPDTEVVNAVYIEATDVLPEEQGKKYVAIIMKTLEEEARHRSYQYLTRNVAIENGYAAKVEKNNVGRIIETYENDSEYGRQRYFKIKL